MRHARYTRFSEIESADAVVRTDRPVLAPFYYLENFELVLRTILSRYVDLLRKEELHFVTAFPRLPLASRALLSRMVMRRAHFFRASKLNYSEIGETRAAAAPLIAAGWVSDCAPLGVDELQQLLTKEELIHCLTLPCRFKSWRKLDLMVTLKAQLTGRRPFEDWYSGGDFVYALLVERLCERFRLMFFGNDRQSWTEFVTSDLGIFRYERVVRSLHGRPFQTRMHIESFQGIQECRELLAEGMPLNELVSIVPREIADSEWLEERRQKLLFMIAREYERAGEIAEALERYLQCSYRGARTRAIRLRVKERQWEEARALCVAAKENPESEAELQHAMRALPQIHRKLKLEYPIDCTTQSVPAFELVMAPEGSRTRSAEPVEYLVRDHLARNLDDPSTVRYVENSLITALFGLLCWPAIFAPVPGAFFHDFHHGPIDLESSKFHRRRKKEFDRCLSLLDSGAYATVIWKHFKEKWGIQSPFVRWHHLDRTLLGWALKCFPAAHLQAWFGWILRDVKENRAGFPDLVQFYPHERTYRMIEVKGPGDRVQDNQQRLLQFCVSRGMPVSVCYVRWEDSTRGAGSAI